MTIYADNEVRIRIATVRQHYYVDEQGCRLLLVAEEGYKRMEKICYHCK